MGTPRQRRVTAAIVLTTLALCALFLAQGTTNWIGSALVDDSPILGAPEERLGAGAAASGSGDEPARQEVDDERVKLMLVGPPVVEDAGPPPDAGPVEVVIGEAGPCGGSATLTGVLMSDREEWSMIAVTLNNNSQLYRIGSTLEGKTVDAIEPMRAFLATGPTRCYLQLFQEGAAGATRAPAAMAASMADSMAAQASTMQPYGRGTETGITRTAMDEGIQRQSDRNFTVQRSFLNEVMANQGEIMRTARVIPHEEAGRTVGVKMYGIRRNSVLGRLGIQNGDMLRTINGFDLTTPDSALEAYTRLTGADSLTLSVVRRGQPITIEYNIQ